MRITRGETGIGQYFLEKVKPFYERESSDDGFEVKNISSKQSGLKAWVSRMLSRSNPD